MHVFNLYPVQLCAWIVSPCDHHYVRTFPFAEDSNVRLLLTNEDHLINIPIFQHMQTRPQIERERDWVSTCESTCRSRRMKEWYSLSDYMASFTCRFQEFPMASSLVILLLTVAMPLDTREPKPVISSTTKDFFGNLTHHFMCLA